MSSLNNIINNFISSSLVPELVNILNGRGINVTSDDIHQALELAQAQRQPSPFSFPGSKGPMMVPPVAPKTKKAAVPVDPNAPQCRWLFTRVPRKGERCTLPADPLTGYCKACSKKEAVKKVLAAGGGGVLEHSATQYTQGVSFQLKQPVPTRETNIDAAPIPGTNLFEILPQRFVAEGTSDGNVVVIGILDGTTRRSLTQEEVRIAESRGLQVALNERIDTQGSSLLMRTPPPVVQSPFVIPGATMRTPQVEQHTPKQAPQFQPTMRTPQVEQYTRPNLGPPSLGLQRQNTQELLRIPTSLPQLGSLPQEPLRIPTSLPQLEEQVQDQ